MYHTISQSYKISPSNSAFGKIKEPLTSSEYIKNKKSIQVFNQQLNFNTFNTQPSYNDFLLFNNGLALQNSRKCRLIPFNKNNLEINLFSKLDLNCVPVVASDTQTPTNINLSNIPFYDFYKIDPEGLLFGKTECGINNFLMYRKFHIKCNPYIQGTQNVPLYSCIS